jgi:hypothetical protein
MHIFIGGIQRFFISDWVSIYNMLVSSAAVASTANQFNAHPFASRADPL